ncbi:hypothetical protein F5B21DRAFT_510335 [Xylaria acuta]|nr:hypothetical protein F5B21DRAFT_510335 [Xylaria acuta]
MADGHAHVPHEQQSQMAASPVGCHRGTRLFVTLQRATGDWIAFDEGDDAIPLLILEENRLESPLGRTSTPGRDGDERLGPAPPQVSRLLSFPAGEPRHTTPEPPASSQQSSLHPDSSPCPPDARSRRNRTPTSSPGFSPSEAQTVSQQGFLPDFRGEDPTHVLMKAYPAGGEGVAQ